MEDFNSKYSGEQVEALLDQVASGNAGSGGGGIAVETDPVFSASPAASITEAKKTEWDNKVPYASKDFLIVGADGFMTSDGDGFVFPGTPASQDGQGFVLATLEDIPNALTESDIAAMGFTKNEGTITEVKMNGVSKGTTGVVDLGDVPTQESVGNLQDHVEDLWSEVGKLTQDKQDALKSGENIKTINGESILGSGDITISGGSGEVGPQGPQGDKGDKGDKGDTGVGVQSVKQTTISNTDGGSNVVTVTLTNGATSTFTVKNGSKGSSGNNGTNGKDGADGATFTPSVDSAGNLSWTNNKGLTNPPTVNIKGPKGDAGEGGGSGGGDEVIQWTTRYAPDYTNGDGVITLDPFVVYYAGDLSHGGTILFNCPPSNAYNEWRIIFYKASDASLNVEVELWVNGITPDISKYGLYELSVVDNDGILLGVMAHYPLG